MTRGRYKRKDAADVGAGEPALRAELGSGSGQGGKKGTRCSIYDGEKVYLGVRVKMPVRDLLRNIRQAQGWAPQEPHGTTVNGDKQRVKTRRRRRNVKHAGFQRKRPTKSLEELAIIVEVLEEDLKTANNNRSPPQSMYFSDPPVSPEWSSTGTGYNSDESDEMIPSPQCCMSYSPECYQVPSPSCFMHGSMQLSPGAGSECGRAEEWFDPQNNNNSDDDWSQSSSAFFWTQLQREESLLRATSDAVLLTADGYGQTALHKVACVGKRALGYAIAKRMAALNSLDLKDSDGMTALLHAAKHNHHLMVADLIRLGASVNETNNEGKSCLHLSAEKGYIRVLEVLKHAMMDGVYVNVEATDRSGMSVLQCASVALKATVRELESSQSANHTRLHALRQEQMTETLECLLQMGSYLHSMWSRSMQPIMG